MFTQPKKRAVKKGAFKPTNVEYAKGYTKAANELKMMKAALKETGHKEQLADVEKSLEYANGKLDFYNKQLKEEHYQMYRQVVRTMFAVDFANGCALDFASYVKKHTRSDAGYEFVDDVQQIQIAANTVLKGMEKCFSEYQLKLYAKVSIELEDEITEIFDRYTEKVTKLLDQTYD